MKSKKIIFSLLSVLASLAFLALGELSLWLVDAYPQPPLFFQIEEHDKAYTQLNSQVAERYFDQDVMTVPSLVPQKFSSAKHAKTLRIFCLGGSTTAGFPYEMTVPFPQQLAFLLQADYPQREIEVINLGLPNINSFTVVDWMPEILQQDPDLILLYIGHNEFYGAYGSGSTISLGNDGRIIRLILKLQKFRLANMITSLIHGFTDSPQIDPGLTPRETLIAEKFIESNSGLRVKTRENFATNLNIIIQACQSAGVPIILSNLVSNVRDQMPLEPRSNPQQKLNKTHELYLKGLKQFQQGDTATAYISLGRARNNDRVPLRGNNLFNEILNEQARRHGIPIVDMENAFRYASPAGIPGNDLFCDHLHPNPLGYHLMARQFYSAMVQTALLPPISRQQLPLKPLFVTDLDWEIGSLEIFKQLHDWPFGRGEVDYTNYPPLRTEATARIARGYVFHHMFWDKAHRNMANHYLKQGDLDSACEEYLAIIEMYPEKMEYYTNLVECAKQAHQWKLVEQTCQKALELSTAKGMFYYNLALSQEMAGDMAAAMVNIKAAVAAPELTPSQSASVHFSYAQFLLDLHRPSEAATVLTELVSKAPGFEKAQELLNKLMN